MFTPSEGGRATANAVTFLLGGLVNFQLDLISQGRPGKAKDGELNMCCPACVDAGKGVSKLEQRYLCESDPKGHGPYERGDVETRCRPTDDGPVLVAADEVQAAKVGTLEKGVCELVVYPAAAVDAVTSHGEKGYVLRPSKGTGKAVTAAAEDAYGILLALVERHPELAFVGALRNGVSRSTYRLGAFRGALFLAEVTLPADLREPDLVEIDVDEAKYAKLEKLALSLLEDEFDQEAHRWDVKAAMAELTERAAQVNPPAPVPVFAGADIDALLDQALAAAAGAKVPA